MLFFFVSANLSPLFVVYVSLNIGSYVFVFFPVPASVKTRETVLYPYPYL